MSKLATPQGDDHPEAAGKHLLDAGALMAAGRSDGAAYLSGYVVECSLKSLWLHETGLPVGNAMPWGRRGHDLTHLHSQVASLAVMASSKIARYLGAAIIGVTSSALGTWRPEQRYRAPTMTLADALAWHGVAAAVYQESVGQMLLDGVL